MSILIFRQVFKQSNKPACKNGGLCRAWDHSNIWTHVQLYPWCGREHETNRMQEIYSVLVAFETCPWTEVHCGLYWFMCICHHIMFRSYLAGYENPDSAYILLMHGAVLYGRFIKHENSCTEKAHHAKQVSGYSANKTARLLARMMAKRNYVDWIKWMHD